MTLSKIIEQARRVADGGWDGQWIGNMADESMTVLATMGLTYQSGEYLHLTKRGEDLLALAERAAGAD